MRKVREVLRLKYAHHLTYEDIGRSCGISRETVSEYLYRAKTHNISWPVPDEIDDQQLEKLLFPKENCSQRRVQPDWKLVRKERMRKGVTLVVLWEEYKKIYPDGMEYSCFCKLYRAYLKTQGLSMRQIHKAGEAFFVDFSGLTVPYTDKSTGKIKKAEIFVAVLGASNYTYVEACASQSLGDWIKANVNALTFIGGVPERIVPDNLKSGIKKAHRYDPDVNITFQEFACHYAVAIVPARPHRPRDKPKVEAGVQIIQRHILARLRHHTFFSVEDINEAIRPLLDKLNHRSLHKREETRHELFEAIDQPALKPLPTTPYVYAIWEHKRVPNDYHVCYAQHFYSVPYQHIHKKIALRITTNTIECYDKDICIARHARTDGHGQTTLKDHMPPSHQAHAEVSIDKIKQDAKAVGIYTTQLIDQIIASKPALQQASRCCIGILRLGKHYGAVRLENAARRAIILGTYRYQSIESILKNGLDQHPPPLEQTTVLPKIEHQNIRGAQYYQ